MSENTTKIMDLRLFNGPIEAEEHAAYMVANFWLKSADRIIQRGESPAKLSDCGYQLVQGELDRDMYSFKAIGRRKPLRSQLNLVRIRRMAIDIAMQKLLTGQFPRVARHFSVQHTDIDASGRFESTLRQSGETA